MTAALVSVCVAAALAVGGPVPSRPAAPASTAVAPVSAPAPAPAPAPAEATPAAPSPTPAPTQPAHTVIPSDPAAALAQPTDPANAAPAPTIVLQPAPAPAPAVVAPAPAPSPPPPRPVVIPPAADALVISGALGMALGGASLLFIAAPASIVRNTALRRAERADALAFTSRKTRYDRARRADDVMEGAFWIGAPLLVTGVALLITGLTMRANARARSRMAAAPGGLELRF